MLAPVLIVVAVGIAAVVLLVKASYRSVPPSRALVISGRRGPRVVFGGGLVLPIVQRADEIDLAVQRVVVRRRGKDGVSCADHVRADLAATFLLRVNDTRDDVLQVARSIGCARATEQHTLEQLFTAKFSEAIKRVGQSLTFEQLIARPDQLRARVLELIGHELGGYVLDDVVIDDLTQTPVECLDPNNLLDAQGIRTIRERTAGARGRVAGTPQAEALAAAATLADELRAHGVTDVRISVEVSCDVSPERAALALELTGDVSDLVALPASVKRGLVDAVGHGRLTCAAGRATLRWDDGEVPRARLVAGARLVHALRAGDQAFR